MKTLSEIESAEDHRLVELCLHGDRDAFGQIVTRYQSAVCAVTYSGCGDLGRSEDLAQETFVAAWRSLGDLKQPARLKPWLCGIARNLANNAARRRQKTPTALAEPIAPETAAGGPSPHEQTASREEEALLWRAIAALPADYREPLVLFYREGKSAAEVAGALELSEEAVRQRLSRARAMLNDRVAKTVETTLSRSGPAKAFALAVLAALPAFALPAKAATFGTVAAKGGAAAKAASTWSLLAVLLSPFLMIFGNYASYRAGMLQAQSEAERSFIKSFYRSLLICVAGSAAMCGALLIWGQHGASAHPRWFAAAVVAMACGYLGAMVGIILRFRSKRRVLFATQRAEGKTKPPAWEYRSRITLLGLPLVHARIGGYAARPAAVRAWFAIGDMAIGAIFAFGGLAIAPVSVGGCAIGLFAWGGFGLGVLVLGGFAIGAWAVGGVAIGWQAFGGCALAWNAAVGGLAVAREFALGDMASAIQCNNPAAQAYARSSLFFKYADLLSEHAAWMNVLWVAPMIFWWRSVAKRGKPGAEPAG